MLVSFLSGIFTKEFTDEQQSFLLLQFKKAVHYLSMVVSGDTKRHLFASSAAEIDEQDTHQIIVIGVAAIVPHNAMADSLMDDISLFVEENTEAEIIDEEREIR